MDEDGNYERRVLGLKDSIQWIQGKMENVEHTRKLGAEIINQRKWELFQKAIDTKARLSHIEKSQHTLDNVSKAVAIGTVFLFMFQAAGLLKGFLWKKLKIREKNVKGYDYKQSKESERQHRNSHHTSRRLHARHWGMCQGFNS